MDPGDLSEGEDLWKQTLDILKGEKKQSMVACASGGKVASYTNHVLTVSFTHSFTCDRMNSKDYKSVFEAIMLRLLRLEVRLNCIVAEKADNKKKIVPQPKNEVQSNLDPKLQAIENAFGGTLKKL